jgi:acetyltransferase-like isoleucine patch superfamily enzyme
MTIGNSDTNNRKDILIGDHVFIGSHVVILGGANIGHNTVIAAGTVVREGAIQPYSLVLGNPMKVKPGYYTDYSNADNEAKANDG